MKNKFLIFFIVEFLLLIGVLTFTFPIFLDDLRTEDGAYLTAPARTAFFISIALILLYFIKILFKITVPKEIKINDYLSEILSLVIDFIGRVSLIVLGSYIGYYYIKNFSLTNNFKFISGSIIVLLAIFLFFRDSVKLSSVLSKL